MMAYLPRLRGLWLLASLLLRVCTSTSSKSDVVLCGQYDQHISTSSLYTFSTNEWGNDGSGSQCITISDNDTVFSATWNWNNNPTAVHAFPNINLNSPLLPLQLSNLSALNISATWSMDATKSSKSLTDVEASADVVVDMFLDPDSTRANSTTLPQYEVMVWIAAFDGRKPIGFSSSIKSPPTVTLNGTDFKLYSGANSNGQFVYSWLASSNITNFSEDISPLLRYLWQHKDISESNYLGIVQFGSEAFHATSNVTFTAMDFDMSIESGTPTPSSGVPVRILPNLAWMMIAISLSLVASI